ncbi:sugar phosphorylase [Paraferrimonas sedimenticola]|uniref:Sucrose phosphorylase n=1 Tax=Paraferrimonas sedimenticola TaxID=375674 RepID=A0AA37RTT1_9GAMM|nr:sugar phosphorylase [Paraferrimonas sedimenticola]GLP95570.1 sucrose phosphorylase [Paraferrimonas sedimenticola]
MSHGSLFERLVAYLEQLYPKLDAHQLARQCLYQMELDFEVTTPSAHNNSWDQSDCWLISYGDSILKSGEKPLSTLHGFIEAQLAETVSGVHILPFFPYSSDDGFSVIDYYSVNDSLGDWNDIRAIGERWDLMADLVINHCSARSGWFENFRHNRDPGRGFFKCADPSWDLSQVVRPRTNDLLQSYTSVDGERWLWCTFSRDQVDLDFENPQVLLEFLAIIRHYLNHKVRIFRLDAIAFVWKIPGTNCLNLAQTHTLVRLLRLLVEHAQPNAVIITETNIPNRENLSYFGNANEAHGIYNFALPPLLLHTLISGDASHLSNWAMAMPPAQNGTFFLNFIASHDGIGLRPVEHILDEAETQTLINTMQGFGGRISWRNLSEQRVKPYEINISLFDALKGTAKGVDSHQLARFICAHCIMLSLEGIPAIYIHSWLATGNDYHKLQHSQHNRAINRHRWQADQLESALADTDSHHAKALTALKRLVGIRQHQSAFHPNATQYTLQLGKHLFGIWRQSLDRRQSVFAIHNVSSQTQSLPLSEINLTELDQWTDLLSQQSIDPSQKSLQLAPYQSVWLTNLANPA